MDHEISNFLSCVDNFNYKNDLLYLGGIFSSFSDDRVIIFSPSEHYGYLELIDASWSL